MSLRCEVHESGAIELFFYDELEGRERERIAAHLGECRDCASALEDLRVIRQVLASRPDVSAPPDGEWSGFMARLEAAIHDIRPASVAASTNVAAFRSRPVTRPFTGLLAMAALLALVTIGVVFVARQRAAMPTSDPSLAAWPSPTSTMPVATAGLRSAGVRHFERSKLVVLGLAGRESAEAAPAEWAYERELASSLLNDTRLYRMAAEERGLTALAGIMRDLELVLLETSMAEETDVAALEQIQRLIRKRGLIQKMDTVARAGM